MAAKINVEPGTLGRWERGENAPDADALGAIIAVTGCDAGWLLTGRTTAAAREHAQPPKPDAPEQTSIRAVAESLVSMISRYEAQQAVPVVLAEINAKPRHPTFNNAMSVKASDYYAMPLLSDRAAAGPPTAVNESDVEDIVLLHRRALRGGTYSAIRVRGDSMHPRIPDESIIAINHERRDPRELEGKIVAARHDGGITVKYLRTLHGQLMLVPENVAFHRIMLLADDDDIVGAVESVWTPLT